MNDNFSSRRGFIKKAFLSSLAIGIRGINSCNKTDYDESFGEIATFTLGKTGVRIPRISLGLGSRFCDIIKEEEAMDVLYYALDNGLFSWDTAFNYQNIQNNVISEERVGKILKYRRKEVFISTKFASITPKIVMENVEQSLNRLQTNYFDNIMIHNVSSMEDVEVLSRKGGIIDVLMRLKDEGVTNFIGFSSHNCELAILDIIDRGDFDIMLMALNHYSPDGSQREELIIPKAHKKGLGILLMKVVRPKETVKEIKVNDLIRYALSIDSSTGLVLGMDSLDVVKSNIELLRSFIPMTTSEKNIISYMLTPFYNNTRLEWLREGYHDGDW